MHLSRLAILAIAFVLGGCCLVPAPDDDSDDTPTAEPTPATGGSDISIESVIFARELDEQWQPVGGAVTEFRADESTVHTRVTIDGRPSSGVVRMRWMWRELQIAEADIDLADVNGGLLFSFGQDTYIKGFMTTPQLYIGSGHRLLLMQGETELGSYPFRVVPPEGARPSRFVSGALFASHSPTEGASNPTSTFGPNDSVYVAGRCALGARSWFDAFAEVSGVQNDTLTQEAIGAADGGDEVNYSFTVAPPEGGWPVGQHRIRLVLDDADVAALPFTVAPPS